MYAASRMAISSTNNTTMVGASGGAQVRGMHVWEKTSGTIYYFVVVGTSVFTSTDGLTFTAVTTLTTNVGTPVRFTEFIDDTNTKKLVLVDGVEGYVFTSNAAGTKITDVDFPTPHVPFPVFLDGYLFLAKADTGDIYNSDLNDPAIWSAGSFISSEMYPDNVVALLKINNYLVAVGTQSCEYFYDAANATSSPLARVDGATLPFGTVLPNTIAANKDTATFIANNNDGQGIIVHIEGQRYTEIPNTFIVPILNARIASSSISKDRVRAFYFRQSGELFYTLAFSDGSFGSPSAAATPSFVYGFTAKAWTEFRYSATGTDYFPVSFTSPITSNQLFTYIAGTAAGGSTAYFGIFKEGDSLTTATDTIVGLPQATIYREVRTPGLMFDTMNVKFLNRLGIVMDNGKSNTGTLSVNIQWSDDDYSTYTTAVSVNVNPNTSSPYNSYFPFITQLGAFRRRAFKISYSGNQFVRFYHLEMDINRGQQ
jgi:hypothetical protein